MPVLDEPLTEPVSLPADSENDLPLNSIPVAELLNAHLPKDASLMPVFISRPGFQGMATKLLVSMPKQPRRRYGCSRNQRHRAAHAKAREELVWQLQNAADNRFCEWLGLPNDSTDEEVASLLARLSTERSTRAPAVHTPPGLTSPSHLYRSPLPLNDDHMSKYDVESEWMDSASDEDQGLSPSPSVPSHSSTFQPIKPRTMCMTGPAASVTPPLSRVEGQPSCDGQVLHAPLRKRVEGHPHCDWELDLRDHPHPQKYARSVAPSVATFEFTDVRSREPHVHDRVPTPPRLRRAKAPVRNERIPCQPQPVTPFRPEACASDSRGYANVVRKPTITVPTTSGAPIVPSRDREPTSNPQIPALMSLKITPPTKNTQFGNRSTHENYMWMLQHAREQGRPRREDRYNILAGVHDAPINRPTRQINWEGLCSKSEQTSPTTHYRPS